MDPTFLWTIFQTIWPLIFSAAILRQIGQVIKRVVPPPETNTFWRYFWKTFPLHPVIAGFILGASNFAPAPEWVESLGGHSRVMFYGFAGYLSVNIHSLIRSWKKYKKEDQS